MVQELTRNAVIKVQKTFAGTARHAFHTVRFRQHYGSNLESRRSNIERPAMKTTLLGVALLLLTTGAAQAADPQRPVRFLLGAGVTFGGDRLATINFTNGDTQNLRAGQLYAVNGGVEFRLAESVSAQATVGYHADSSSYASNGSIRFRRFPVELLAHYLLDDRWRIGGGLRFVNNIELRGRGVAASDVFIDFKNAVGGLVEVEYRFSRLIGLKVRGVAEEYKARGAFTGTADANHIGIYTNFYF